MSDRVAILTGAAGASVRQRPVTSPKPGGASCCSTELGEYNITANMVAPGSTTGAMLEASATFYDLDSPMTFAVHHPLRRLVEPDQVAALLRRLALDGEADRP